MAIQISLVPGLKRMIRGYQKDRIIKVGKQYFHQPNLISQQRLPLIAYPAPAAGTFFETLHFPQLLSAVHKARRWKPTLDSCGSGVTGSTVRRTGGIRGTSAVVVLLAVNTRVGTANNSWIFVIIPNVKSKTSGVNIAVSK